MAAILASSSCLQRVGAFSPAQRPSRRALVVRATAATEEKVEAKAEAAPAAVKEEQQTAAPAPTVQKAAAPAAAPSVRRPHSTATTYGERLATDPLEVMAFNGSLPEINNGRLAMLGFLAALGCEIFTGKPVLAQLAGNGSTILTWVLLVTAGTAVPILRGIKNEEAFGPLTPERELFNGRAAMVGFASLLLLEAFRGTALF